MKTKLKKLIPLITISFVILINLSFGLPRLSNYTAVDEHLWTFDRTPDFWNAIKEKNLKRTKINDKPGITVALISGFGLLNNNPLEYRDSIQEPKTKKELAEIKKINFDFRLPIYIFILLLAPLYFFLLKRLFNQSVALFSIILIYLSPILLGMSLFVNPDSLLWAFISLSTISFLLYQKTKKFPYAGLSGLFLGLSLLTKYVATILFPFFLLLIFLNYIFNEKKREDEKYFKNSFISFLILLASTHLTVIIFFPAVWKDIDYLWETTFINHPFEPIFPFFVGFLVLFGAETFFLKNKITKKILIFFTKFKKQIVALIFSVFILTILAVIINILTGMHFYDFEHALSKPKSGDHNLFDLALFTKNILTAFYVIIFSVTPWILGLFFFFLGFNLKKLKTKQDPNFLAIFSILLFIIIYYAGNALNFIEATVRYQISIYPLIAIVAAYGMYQLFEIEKIKKYFSYIHALFILIALSTLSLFLINPYFFDYSSEFLPKKYIVNPKGMGDGSYEASEFLNSLPNAQNLNIWTDKVAVCQTFVGKCQTSLKNDNIDNEKIDYLVLSQGNITKTISFAKGRGIKNIAFSKIKDYYLTDNFNEKKIEIDGRPNNFVKIIKTIDLPFKVKTPFKMPLVTPPTFPKNVCNIQDYGAQKDNNFINTEIFKKAIQDCSQKGGGEIVVPEGIWLTGPIRLTNNINLKIEKNGIIKFTNNLDDYLPAVFTRFEGIEFYGFSPMIYAEDSKNIAITGAGEIQGQGKSWENISASFNSNVDTLYELSRKNVPVKNRIFTDKNNPIQPSFVQFINCKDILIEDIKISNGPNWTIHPIYSKNITINNIRLKTSARNTDGIVIDSSKNVYIYDSTLNSGDDAIVIKSGKDSDGWRVGKPSENIILHDNFIEGGHAAIAIGSEMSGGVKNVYAYGTDVGYVDYGIRFKSMEGRGGEVSNIWIENTEISRAVQSAIEMDLTYGTPPSDYNKNKPPFFHDITIEDLKCRRTRYPITLFGLSNSPLENITLKDIKITSTRDIRTKNVKDEKFKDVDIEVEKK